MDAAALRMLMDLGFLQQQKGIAVKKTGSGTSTNSGAIADSGADDGTGTGAGAGTGTTEAASATAAEDTAEDPGSVVTLQKSEVVKNPVLLAKFGNLIQNTK